MLSRRFEFASRVLVAAILVVAGVSPACAHEGPEHVIEALTAEIERTGPTAELLYRRAMEYRALRDFARAEADLRAAVRQAPDDPAVQMELARVLAKQRDKGFEAALWVDGLQRTYAVGTKPSFYPDLLALEAELDLEYGAWPEAVDALNRAITMRGEVAWYVLRSRAQSRLPEQRTEQLQGLRDGYATTRNPVLLRELVDALMRTTGAAAQVARAEAALLIDAELAANRYRSAWLIRRAKLRALEGLPTAAKTDLRDALAELELRIHPTRPDVELVIQRGTAHAMLNDVARAQTDLHRAERGHAPDWMLAPLVEALAGRTAPTAVSPED